MSKHVRKRISLWFAVTIVVVISALCLPASAQADTAGYPYADYNGPGSNAAEYVWTNERGGMWSNYGFAYRNCTDFVAWKLNATNGLDFANNTPHGRYGNAKDWKATAEANGYTVNATPAVGAVAWWAANAHGMSSYGHVAWVSAVKDDDVTVEEYNNPGGGAWSSRTLKKDRVSGYIHFKDLPPGSSNATPPPTPHLYEAFHWNTSSGMTEVRQLNATSNYTAWTGGWPTPDGWHGGDSVDYGMADANGDGVQDLYVILFCCTNSGATEVKILNGANNFSTWIGGWVTASSLHAPGTVHYAVGNYDGDNKPDVYEIATTNTPSGHVEVKVLTGASNFSQWAGGWITPDGWHNADGIDFVLSKCGTSGRPHLYEILHENTSSGMTEVRQFDAATSYTTFVGGWVTPDGIHSGDQVAYTAGGCNANSKPNIYAVTHSHTTSGMTEVKVLDGANSFQRWIGGWVTPDGWHSGNDIDFVMPSS